MMETFPISPNRATSHWWSKRRREKKKEAEGGFQNCASARLLLECSFLTKCGRRGVSKTFLGWTWSSLLGILLDIFYHSAQKIYLIENGKGPKGNKEMIFLVVPNGWIMSSSYVWIKADSFWHCWAIQMTNKISKGGNKKRLSLWFSTKGMTNLLFSSLYLKLKASPHRRTIDKLQLLSWIEGVKSNKRNEAKCRLYTIQITKGTSDQPKP